MQIAIDKSFFQPLLVSLFVAAAFVFPLCASVTERLPGAESAQFVESVRIWLDDNDANSLPVLAKLANDGNTAARIVLSRIELTDRASSEFVRSLSRNELLNLFRPDSSGSLFRPSWLKREADSGNQFAQVLFDATSYGINLPAIKRLYEIGEIQAAEHLIRKIAVDGNREEQNSLLEFLDSDSELHPYVRGFRDSSKGIATAHTGLQQIIGSNRESKAESVKLDNDIDTKNAMQFVDIGYQANDRIIQYSPTNRHYNTITRWIMSAPEASGIANMCRLACDEKEISACANIAFGLIGGYYEVIRFDSPLETVIPQSDYLNSQRVVGMTLRRVASVRTDSHQKIFTDLELAEKSRCLAEAVRTIN